MTNLRKITKKEIKEYVSEVGEWEKEHRKYSSFYCWSTHVFTQADIDELASEGIDASEFLGVMVTMNGMWDDSYGTEWDSIDYSKVEEYEEHVPEKVIPAHTVTRTRTEKFVPVWE